MNSIEDLARSQVVEILGCCIFHAKGLKDCLEQEHSALETQDVEALMAAINAKSQSVRELQELDRKRSQLCVEAGFEQGPLQMQEFIGWCDTDDELTRSWNQLLELAEECNTLNLSNGAIIRIRKQQIEEGIAVLRGMQPGTHTYSRTGNHQEALGNKAIAEA